MRLKEKVRMENEPKKEINTTKIFNKWFLLSQKCWYENCLSILNLRWSVLNFIRLGILSI